MPGWGWMEMDASGRFGMAHRPRVHFPRGAKAGNGHHPVFFSWLGCLGLRPVMHGFGDNKPLIAMPTKNRKVASLTKPPTPSAGLTVLPQLGTLPR